MTTNRDTATAAHAVNRGLTPESLPLVPTTTATLERALDALDVAIAERLVAWRAVVEGFRDGTLTPDVCHTYQAAAAQEGYAYGVLDGVRRDMTSRAS
jgi:hypothetical protein